MDSLTPQKGRWQVDGLGYRSGKVAAGGAGIAITGTPSTVDASGGNGSTSVTVPADCNVVVAFWSHWDEAGGSTIGSLTLNSESFTTRADVAEGTISSLASGVGVATLVNPSTGSQTLAWTWSAGGARSEGGVIVVVYIKNGNTADPYRDADRDADEDTTDVTVTIDSASTDLVVAFAHAFGGTPDITGGTEVVDDGGPVNSYVFDIATLTAGASSTVVAMTGENFSSIAAISLKAA